MFTALLLEGEARREVDLLTLRLEQPDTDPAPIQAARYCCKFCAEEMRPRFPAVRRWHFFHKRESSSCPYRPESEDHRILKYELVRKWSAKYNIPLSSFRVEHRLEIGAGYRIADLYLEHQGKRFAFEVQLSPISWEELAQRSLDYDDAGIRVFWVFLEHADWYRGAHLDWLKYHNYSYLSVRFEGTVQTARL